MLLHAVWCHCECCTIVDVALTFCGLETSCKLRVTTCAVMQRKSRATQPLCNGLRLPCAGEDSLSHHVDYNVGVSVIDRFTYYMLDFFQGMGPGSTATMQNLIDHVR